MDFATALEQTATRKGPLSAIDKLLDAADDDARAQIVEALHSDLQAAHLGRALTKLAHHHKVIGERSSIDGQSVQSWRAKHAS